MPPLHGTPTGFAFLVYEGELPAGVLVLVERNRVMTWKAGTVGDLSAALIEAAMEIAQKHQFAPGFAAVFYFQLQGITFRVRVDVNEADLQTNLDIKGE